MVSLKDVFKERNITQQMIMDELKVSQPYASSIISGKKKIGKKMALKLNQLFAIDINLLMFNNDDALFNIKSVFSDGSKKNMMIVPLKAYGGFLSGYESRVYLDQLEKISFPMIRSECYAFEVDGYSMINEYNPGDFFIGTPIEGFKDLVKQRDYVFQTVDGLILKKFDKIDDDFAYLSSINEDYNPVKPIHLKDIKVIYHKEAVIKF